jgi:hypothetical protein
VRLSQTETGQRWIGNFRDEETETAALLLDSLHIASDSTVRSALSSLLSTEASRKWQLPAALYSVREPSEFHVQSNAIAFDDFQPGSDLSGAPGSEAGVANIIRELAVPGSDLIGPTAGLDDLRRLRVRSLILVTDYAGSGDQAADYLAAFVRNRTLRSWVSYGLLRFHLVMYATSVNAFKRLGDNPQLTSISRHVQAPSVGYIHWDDSQRKAVIRLCRKYANDRDESLGHGGDGGLFVRQSTVPDNLPQILTQTTGRTARQTIWAPFFAGRRWPPSLLNAAAESRLSRGDWTAFYQQLHQAQVSKGTAWPNNRDEQFLAMILLAAAHQLRDPYELAAKMDVPIEKLHDGRQLLQELGLLRDNGRPTAHGTLELKWLRHKTRRVADMPVPPAEPYYPSALRRVAST